MASDQNVGQFNDSTPDSSSGSSGSTDSPFASFLQSMYSSDSTSSKSATSSSGSDNGYKSTSGQVALGMDNALSQLAGDRGSISQSWANEKAAAEADAAKGAEKAEKTAVAANQQPSDSQAKAPTDGTGNQLASNAKVELDGSIQFDAWAADKKLAKAA